MRFLCFRQSSAISSGFSTRWPLGLWGVLIINSFVFGVIIVSSFLVSNCQSGFVSGVCFMCARAHIKHTPLTKPDWQFDTKKLDTMITPKTKLLIINTPQRPNGHLVENPEEIAELCLKHKNLMVISDEIFSHVVYDGKKHKTISALPGMAERTIVIDTFSKTYAMTGWRIGWSVAPKPVIEKLSIFLQDTITNVAAFIQKAAYAAMVGPQEWVVKKTQLL